MPKGNYSSRRDRRITQPAGIGGAFTGLFQLRVLAWDTTAGEIAILAVLPNAAGEVTPGFAPWLIAKPLGQDTHRVIVNGILVESSIEINDVNLAIITIAPGIGDIEIWIKGGTIDLDATTGLRCAGIWISSDEL